MKETYEIAKRYKNVGDFEKAREYFLRGMKITDALMKNSAKETVDLIEVFEMLGKYSAISVDVIDSSELMQLHHRVLECYNLIIESKEDDDWIYRYVEQVFTIFVEYVETCRVWFEENELIQLCKNVLECYDLFVKSDETYGWIVQLKLAGMRLRIQEILTDADGSYETYNQLIEVYRQVGLDYEFAKENEKAEECYRARLEMLELKKEDEDKESLKALSDAYFDFGMFYDGIDNLEKALEKYECSRQIEEKLFESDKSIQGCEDLITIYDLMAQIHKKEGYFGKALKLYQAGLEIIAIVQENDTLDKKEKLLSKCHLGIAEIYKLQGFDKKAEEFLAKNKEAAAISGQENQIVVEISKEKEMPKLAGISEKKDKQESSLKKMLVNLGKKIRK